MAMNRIQFQPGMSLPQFLKRFGSEEQCAQAVEQARWPDGFSCPRCGDRAHCRTGPGGRLYQCNACHHQASLIAGSLFASTKLPLRTWFLVIYFISQAKTGISALALMRHLGVSYPTAWLMHHKILAAMAEREAHTQLQGMVQIDDAYLGGERSGQGTGRGTAGKTAFVAAVSLNDQGHPLYAKFSAVAGFTSQAIRQWASASLMPGSLVLSDGLACFGAVVDAQCLHAPTVIGRLKPRELPEFTWINTLLGNLKRSLAGTHHAFDFAKYACSYFAGFAYRFNRRFDLRGLLACLIVDSARCSPRPRSSISSAEDRC